MASEQQKFHVVLPNPAKDLKAGGSFTISAKEVKLLVSTPDGGTAVFIHGVFQPVATSAPKEDVAKLLGWEPVEFVERITLH